MGPAPVPPYRLGALLNGGFHSGGRAPPATAATAAGMAGGFRVGHWFGVVAAPVAFHTADPAGGLGAGPLPGGVGSGHEGVVAGFVTQVGPPHAPPWAHSQRGALPARRTPRSAARAGLGSALAFSALPSAVARAADAPPLFLVLLLLWAA